MIGKITIELVERSYLLGAIKHSRIGSMSRLDLFGLPVYMRVGNVRWVLGVYFRRGAE
jgi:hypothetical protein